MALLENIMSPADVKALSVEKIPLKNVKVKHLFSTGSSPHPAAAQI